MDLVVPKKQRIDYTDPRNQILLYYNIVDGCSVHVFQEWLENGLNVNCRFSHGSTLLMKLSSFSRKGENVKILRMLVEGVPYERSCRRGMSRNRSVLMNPERDLLTSDVQLAEVNTQDSRGKTALMCAARDLACSAESAVRILIEGGAKVNMQDDDDLSALMHSWTFYCEGRTERVVRMLIEGGARIDLRDHRGWNALICCTKTCPTILSTFSIDVLIDTF